MGRLSLLVVFALCAHVEQAAAQDPDEQPAADAPASDAPAADAPAADAPAADAPQPRYLTVVRAELERLQLAPVCEILDENRARCQVRHRTSDATSAVDVVVLVDETADTIYVYTRVGVSPPDGPENEALMRRIAALNWRLLSTKLEWNPSGGAIRLSGLLHTDSNLDRLAFRRLMRLLPPQAEQYAREFDAIQGVGHSGE